ncbi:hypothetical protein [Stenotrophomonas sp.]|uniref:hypothetical protein n=1 Tax=Stenotrophomonas sp. TaxID=69392 RepID=UPI0028AE6625|nr:hypothetical protein [Stenotrophomonas sp.]
MEALAAIIAERVDKRKTSQPKLRVINTPRPTVIDSITRDSVLRRIRWLRDQYNLGCLIAQATFNLPGIDCLEDADLMALHREMEYARECCVEGVSIEEAGLIRNVAIPLSD